MQQLKGKKKRKKKLDRASSRCQREKRSQKEKKPPNLSTEMIAELGKDALAIRFTTRHRGITKEVKPSPMAKM